MTSTATPSESDHFDHDFRGKIQRHGKKAGRQVVQTALRLYYTATSPETPAKIKAIIYGALVYFIWPADGIPDVIPGAGFSDDLALLAGALVLAAAHITPGVKQQAAAKLADWFGEDEGPASIGKGC